MLNCSAVKRALIPASGAGPGSGTIQRMAALTPLPIDVAALRHAGRPAAQRADLPASTCRVWANLASCSTQFPSRRSQLRFPSSIPRGRRAVKCSRLKAGGVNSPSFRADEILVLPGGAILRRQDVRIDVIHRHPLARERRWSRWKRLGGPSQLSRHVALRGPGVPQWATAACRSPGRRHKEIPVWYACATASTDLPIVADSDQLRSGTSCRSPTDRGEPSGSATAACRCVRRAPADSSQTDCLPSRSAP